jgi:hypothetical protein
MTSQRIHITEVDAGQQCDQAVQRAHYAIWTGGYRETARIQEVAASDATRY